MPFLIDKLIKRSGIFRGRRVAKGGRLVEKAEHLIVERNMCFQGVSFPC